MPQLPMLPFVLTVAPALGASIVKNKELVFKRVVAAFFYGAILFGLASWNMDVAVAFAWVGAATSLLLNGQILFTAIRKSVA